MIDHVNALLSAWGKWAVRCETAGLGYPSVSPMFQQMQHGGAYRSREPIGCSDYVHDTDAAVQRLDPEDRKLCREMYKIGGTTVAIASRLGMARQRFYERLHVVHQRVLGHLLDIEAGC